MIFLFLLYFFHWSCMDVRVELWIKLSAEELMLLNCGVGEDSWESLGLQEIQPVHPKWDQSWVFIRRSDVETETPVFWPPDVKSWLIWKDPDAGKYWGQEEKGTTEDEMAGWHHWLDGRESQWTLGVGDEQEAWHAAIHGVSKSRTRLSDWTELNSRRSKKCFGWYDCQSKSQLPVRFWV